MSKSDSPVDSSTAKTKAAGSSTKKIVSLPTLEYYRKTYANSLGEDDQKAVRVFRDYESHEKLRRLQTELQWIKKDEVTEPTLERVVGKKRAAKFQGYVHWAELMLIWISQLKR